MEGGEYCGPGKFEVAESVFAQATSENPVSFEDKLLCCLQGDRTHLMQVCYNLISNAPVNSQLGALIDWNDIHVYNTAINLYGDELGLRKEAANNDDEALIDPLYKLIVRHTINRAIERLFWNRLNLKHHLRVLSEAIGTPQLGKQAFYDFWLRWIDRQRLEEPMKEALKEELSNGRLFGRDIEVQQPVNEGERTRSVISEEFILLMLLDLGIVKKEGTEVWIPRATQTEARLPTVLPEEAAPASGQGAEVAFVH